jgi:hypothetical protein
MPSFIRVDPCELHLPPARASGADPAKLHRQIATYGAEIAGMPAIWLYRAADGALIIFDGVTRATRVAKLRPGTLLAAEIVGDLPGPGRHLPTIGERLP